MSKTATQGSDLVWTDSDRPTPVTEVPPIITEDAFLETDPGRKSTQDILSQPLVAPLPGAGERPAPGSVIAGRQREGQMGAAATARWGRTEDRLGSHWTGRFAWGDPATYWVRVPRIA
jgi:hypothetical protein